MRSKYRFNSREPAYRIMGPSQLLGHQDAEWTDTCIVYCIINEVTGRCYVGQTRHWRTRKYSHMCALRNGTHHARGLQVDYNQYGEENFSFLWLESCASDQVFRIERKWIRLLASCRNGYNTQGKGVDLPSIALQIVDSKLYGGVRG
jgi:group I intron endonuclease